MSVRTIVEFNHDFAHEISENAPEFVKLLRRAMGSGSKECWERLERFGVTFAVSAHHSDERTVSTQYQTVKL